MLPRGSTQRTSLARSLAGGELDGACVRRDTVSRARRTTLRQWRWCRDRLGDIGARARVRRFRVAPAGARRRARGRSVRGRRPHARRHLLASGRPLHPRRCPRELEGRRRQAEAARRCGAAHLRAAGALVRRRAGQLPARDPGWTARAPSRRLRHTRTATRGRSAGAERHGRGVPAAARRPRGRATVDWDALREMAEPLPCRCQPPLLRAPGVEPGLVNVTVFGATGVVGRALVPLLGEHELTAVSRTARDEPGARWVVADAASGDGVAAALVGADVVYYLVHSLGAQNFEEQDRAAAETVAHEAANAGVRQIVYLGGLGADGAHASPHLRSRRETGERLASAGGPVTTLRAAMIVGKGSAAFETILGLVKRLPVMVTPSWVSTPTQPIALDDVARYLAGVCGNEASYGEGYDTGGPEVMTYRQMIERIAALLGRTPRIVEVPVLTPYLSSLWLNLVTPVNASVARPLVEGLRNPTIAREERIRKLLPLELTPFDEAARRALTGAAPAPTRPR